MTTVDEHGIRWSPDVAPRGRRRARGPGVQLRLVVVTVLALLVVLGIGAVMASGLRAYGVRTPSMGTTAPVGSMVVVEHVASADLRVGDVITFRPPTGAGATYTHRIVAISTAGIETRGDANAASDAWTLDPSDVVGRAAVIVPVAGWAVQGLPWVVAGIAAVWFATGFVRRRETRAALRVFGSALSVAVVSAVLRPFVAVQLLGTSGGEHPVAHVAATGMLPVRASVAGGGVVHLVSGAAADVRMAPGVQGVQHVVTRLDLPFAGWVVLGAVCCIPIVVSLVVRVGRPSS